MNNTIHRPLVCAPIGLAWRGMTDFLFRPFNLPTWIGMGFTAWLAHLGESGLSLDLPVDSTDFREQQATLGLFLAEYWTLIVVGLSIALFAIIALALLFTWLRCRGVFMFLDNAVRRQSLVATPWNASRAPGQSLFYWTLGFAALAMIALALALSPAMVMAYQRAHGAEAWPLPLVLGLTIPLALLWIIVVMLVSLALHDFVVPIMARKNLTARQAWRALAPLIAFHPLPFLSYAVARTGLAMLAASAIFLGGCLTCCCLFVVLMVPVLWAVVLLPWLLFIRLYSLHFLRQFGPEFDLWAGLQPPTLPPALPVTEPLAYGQESCDETS